MARTIDDLGDYSDEQIREIASLAIQADGSIAQDTTSENLDEGLTSSSVAYLTRRWDEYWWSPLMFMDNSRIKIWSNGDWEYYGGVDNRSRHSDWDVWLDLRVKSTFNNQIIHEFATDVGFIDIDHDDDPQEMKARGHSDFIRRHYNRFRDNDYIFNRNKTRRRDN